MRTAQKAHAMDEHNPATMILEEIHKVSTRGSESLGCGGRCRKRRDRMFFQSKFCRLLTTPFVTGAVRDGVVDSSRLEIILARAHRERGSSSARFNDKRPSTFRFVYGDNKHRPCMVSLQVPTKAA